MLTMRSEEKENFRLVSPMIMTVMFDYVKSCRRIANQVAPMVRVVLLSCHCASMRSYNN